MITPPFVFDDGGREAAGFRGTAGDCFTRAVAITTGRPYRPVYDEITRYGLSRGYRSVARLGPPKPVFVPYMRDVLGAVWTAKMGIGTGCRTHVRKGEVPETGRWVLQLSGHVTALVDGTVYDLYDPSREGLRCVYGWWEIPHA